MRMDLEGKLSLVLKLKIIQISEKRESIEKRIIFSGKSKKSLTKLGTTSIVSRITRLL